MPEHDRGYRLLFSHASMVEALLRAFVREEWVDQIDFASLEKVGASFVGPGLRDRHGDGIWKLSWNGGAVYLLLEFQSTSYRFMALRLLTYVALFYEDQIRNKELTSEGKLPPVLLLVLYNGNRPWTAPRELDALIAPAPGSLGRTRPRLRYLVVDERRVDPGELDGVSDLMAILVRIETARSPEDLVRLAESLPSTVPQEQPDLRRAFAAWLSQVLRRSFPSFSVPHLNELEEIAMLEENLIAWRKRKEREDQTKGMEKGMRIALLRILESRFGPLSRGVRGKVGAVHSTERLGELLDGALVAGSLQELGLL
jgi:hypothetical protein